MAIGDALRRAVLRAQEVQLAAREVGAEIEAEREAERERLRQELAAQREERERAQRTE